MNKLKILVVEDEIVIAMDLQELLEELGYEVPVIATSYDEAINELQNNQFDLAMLDIQIEGEKSGIDIARYINSEIIIPIIFLTSNTDKKTINEAVATKPSAYLVKPFNVHDLYSSIELAISNFEKEPHELLPSQKISDAIFIKNKHLFHKVKFDDIVYIQSQHVYIEIYTNNGNKHLVRNSLGEFLNKLPNQFFRTHRSFAINLNFLDAINSFEVIVHKHSVPISKTHREELMQLVNSM